MPLAPGSILGQYQVLAPLGTGGMGEVYRARDMRLNREVAIKILPELLSCDRFRLQRFEQEARAVAALNHPNILAVYQMGTFEEMPYLVSELLEGETLWHLLRRGPLPLRKVIDYGVQIAHALAAAHAKGVVHRDLKPENIFITNDGRVKILDFGLAKMTQPEAGEAEPAPTVMLETKVGAVMGTAGYMSPEQIRGQDVDYRSDIFAFGLVLHEMLTGRRTFQKPTSAETLTAILHEEAPLISALAPRTPVALQKIVQRALEKHPQQRFQSASDMAFALESLSGSVAAGVPREETGNGIFTHRRLLITAPIVLAVLAVVVFAWRMQPQAESATVSNWVQLTHDGQPKTLIGSDGFRLYLGMGMGNANSFAYDRIAQLPVGGGEPQNMTPLHSPDMVPVQLSPDGAAFLVVDGQGAPPRGPLWSYPILGDSPRRMGNVQAETAAWSPDGKMLAYSNLNQLFVANSDGSNPRKLVTGSGDIKNVAWSPDSTRIRFDATESLGVIGQQVAWEVSSAGNGLRRLVSPGQQPVSQCCGKWTADGKYFVFLANGQIWAITDKSSLLARESKAFELTSSPMLLSSLLPSRDGKKLFIVGHTYRGELDQLQSGSKALAPFMGGISAEYVDFSKDGQWVVYVSYPEGILWRSKADGTERLQLTSPPMYPVLPRWSPDGKNLVFFVFGKDQGDPARIYEVAADGGTPQLLLASDTHQQLDPNWSPDGKKIIFAGESNDPGSVIRILDVATGQISELPNSQGLYSPRWSPNDDYICAFSGDSSKIMLYALQSQKWSTLATGSFSWLNLSHDGKYVYVLNSAGQDALLRIAIDGHRTEKILDLATAHFTGKNGPALSLTPEDDPLLLRDTGTQDVYSLDWEER